MIMPDTYVGFDSGLECSKLVHIMTWLRCKRAEMKAANMDA